MDWTAFWNNIGSAVVTTGIKILISLIVLFIAFKLINLIGRKIEKAGNKEKADKTIMVTLAYAFRLACKAIVTVCIIAYLGIDTSGITALIASLGVGIGLAVNGALSNMAGGVLLIITRPFRIDDFIEAQGLSGTVVDIHITTTKLVTPDNKIVYVPNGALANGNIVNYSEKDTRRIDFTFSIDYAESFDKAKEIIKAICDSHEKVLKDPEPMIRISEHAASSINIVTRVWVKSEDYWNTHFDILEAVKREFDANGISIPFNQLDVHVKND